MNSFNPVEKNMFVSLYGIDLIPNKSFNIQFSLRNIEDIITVSGANIDGKLSELTNRSSDEAVIPEISRRRYIAMLSESTAAVGIFPTHLYASFFLSTCGTPNPLLSLEPLIYLFRPMRAEVRFFTSSAIDRVFSEDLPAEDEDVFWKQLDEKRTPYYYELRSKEKEIKGVYFDLVSTLHSPEATETLDEVQIDPVESNMLVSLYNVSREKIRELTETCSIPLLEKIVLKSTNRVVGRITKEFRALDNSTENGFSYVGQLVDGVAAFHATPESKYVSFYMSGSEENVPILSLNQLIKTFEPAKAEVRYFSSSPITSVDQLNYRQNVFWNDFYKAEIPDTYSLRGMEKTRQRILLRPGPEIDKIGRGERI